MKELKPCPFCGSEAHIVEHTANTYPNSYGVKCTKCSSMSYQGWITAKQAIEAWNKRVENDE